MGSFFERRPGDLNDHDLDVTLQEVSRRRDESALAGEAVIADKFAAYLDLLLEERYRRAVLYAATESAMNGPDADDDDSAEK